MDESTLRKLADQLVKFKLIKGYSILEDNDAISSYRLTGFPHVIFQQTKAEGHHWVTSYVYGGGEGNKTDIKSEFFDAFGQSPYSYKICIPPNIVYTNETRYEFSKKESQLCCAVVSIYFVALRALGFGVGHVASSLADAELNSKLMDHFQNVLFTSINRLTLQKQVIRILSQCQSRKVSR